MSGTIDPVSALLGELREQAKQASADRERLEKKLDTALSQLSAVRGDVDKMKNRGIGLIAGVALTSSLVGAKVAPWISKIFAVGIGFIMLAASPAA